MEYCKTIENTSSSSSTWNMIWKYDVFVSFRGEDTRNNFADHLFAAFQRKSIVAFRDDTKLKKGESISSKLIQAIQTSRVLIVILSKKYATSTWCLQELANIAECIKVTGQSVLPVFYDVNPSEVRKQNRNYGKAFADHEERFREDLETVQRWREALVQVANLSGWDVRNKPQYGEIEKIVEEVISILGHKVSSPLDDLVGMQSREEEQLEKLLALDSDSDDDVPVVRMGGRGSKRIKLLKHAGSLNYKRLLPFLLNTRKDDSCDSANDHHPKRQKCLDQTPLLPISASNLEVTPLSDSNVCVPLEDCKANYGTQQKAGFHACDLSNAGSSSRSQIPEFQSSHESCKVIQLQDEQVVLNGLCKLESSTNPPNSDHRIDLPITPLTRPTNEVTREDGASASGYSEVKGNSSFLICSNNDKLHETHECSQSLSQVKVLDQLTVPSVGFKKEILKRRGCKGLCTCLNCVSFQLHADRAVEFSRNLLLDAEEVAQDLMKELSHLRNMLERSTHSVHNNHVFDGSQFQVKEACFKALATEQLAKDRLSQMNDDLDIHCRILRPRVRFAEHVEEKVIQPDR